MPNAQYKQDFLAIKYDYDTQCSMDEDTLNRYISSVDSRLNTAHRAVTATKPLDLSGVSRAFEPISNYYANLLAIKVRLSDFLERASDDVVDLRETMENKERYENRAYPQYSVKPRELVYGLFSELRPSSVPIVLAAGVFMASISILIVFQMFGFTGQINVPPAISGLTASSVIGQTPGPWYSNPVIMSGVSILLGVVIVVLVVMYYKAKENNKR